jgi:uncharacterized Zn-binding protein involved in type VI secretion
MAGISFPAARQGDPITHDLLVPSGVIGPPLTPPVGGLVIIEGMPAAHVGCTVVCIGATSLGPVHPPLPPGAAPQLIISGSPGVYINGMPAGRWAPSGDGSTCGAFLGDPKLTILRSVFIGGQSGLGVGALFHMLIDAKVNLAEFLNPAGPSAEEFAQAFSDATPAEQALALNGAPEGSSPKQLLYQIANTRQELADIHARMFQLANEVEAELEATRQALKPGEEMPVSRDSYKVVRKQLRTTEEKDPVTRQPLRANRGKYEGFVDESVLKANVDAYAQMRAVLNEAQPDVILGTKRGGAFIADVLEHGNPSLGPAIIRPEKTPIQADMYPALRAEIEQRIANGDRKFIFVDCYMGGFNAEYLVDKVFAPLLEKHVATHPDLRFGSLWIRETFGLELGASTERFRAKEPWQKHIGGRQINVPWVFGDDVDTIMDGVDSQPLHVYAADGRVLETVPPAEGETTRDLTIRMLNGEGRKGSTHV